MLWFRASKMSQGDQRVRRPPRILRVNTVPMPLSTPPTSPGVRWKPNWVQYGLVVIWGTWLLLGEPLIPLKIEPTFSKELTRRKKETFVFKPHFRHTLVKRNVWNMLSIFEGRTIHDYCTNYKTKDGPESAGAATTTAQEHTQPHTHTTSP